MRANDVAGIVREIVSAMVNYCLKSPNGSENGSLAIVELGYCEAHGEEDHVYRNSL